MISLILVILVGAVISHIALSSSDELLRGSDKLTKWLNGKSDSMI